MGKEEYLRRLKDATREHLLKCFDPEEPDDVDDIESYTKELDAAKTIGDVVSVCSDLMSVGDAVRMMLTIVVPDVAEQDVENVPGDWQYYH